MSASLGPFASEREARAAVHQVVSPEPGWAILRAEGNRELLRRALDEAGVTLAAHDERILGWLAGWEDSTIAVIAGWISRADRSGREQRPALTPAGRDTLKAARALVSAIEAGEDALAGEVGASDPWIIRGYCFEVLREVLAVIDSLAVRVGGENQAAGAPVLDSEAWTCRGCGGQMIGQRTPDDLCGPCIGFRLAAPHSAESEDQAGGDDERCCPDCDGNPHHLAGGCQDAAEGGQR